MPRYLAPGQLAGGSSLRIAAAAAVAACSTSPALTLPPGDCAGKRPEDQGRFDVRNGTLDIELAARIMLADLNHHEDLPPEQR